MIEIQYRKFFCKYVENGSVAYSKISTKPDEIESLYAQVGAVRLGRSDDNTKKAFYANACYAAGFYKYNRTLNE
jgi:hypothetical protein